MIFILIEIAPVGRYALIRIWAGGGTGRRATFRS